MSVRHRASLSRQEATLSEATLDSDRPRRQDSRMQLCCLYSVRRWAARMVKHLVEPRPAARYPRESGFVRESPCLLLRRVRVPALAWPWLRPEGVRLSEGATSRPCLDLQPRLLLAFLQMSTTYELQPLPAAALRSSVPHFEPLSPDSRSRPASPAPSTSSRRTLELNPGTSLAPVDGGKDAWIFLAAATGLEVLVWGEPRLSARVISDTKALISLAPAFPLLGLPFSVRYV